MKYTEDKFDVVNQPKYYYALHLERPFLLYELKERQKTRQKKYRTIKKVKEKLKEK